MLATVNDEIVAVLGKVAVEEAVIARLLALIAFPVSKALTFRLLITIVPFTATLFAVV